MSNASVFIIQNGVLKKYVGPGGDVVVPEGITAIGNGAFRGCKSVTGITLPEGVTSIGSEAFEGCSNLEHITIPESLQSIGMYAFKFCEKLADANGCLIVKGTLLELFGSDEKTSITIPDSVTRIAPEAIFYFTELKTLTLLGKVTYIAEEAIQECWNLKEVFAPNTSFAVLKEAGLQSLAAAAFIKQYSKFPDPAIRTEYIAYLSAQRKKQLPGVYKKDAVDILRMMVEAKKITEKNVEQDYLIPARQCKAEKCIAYLESLFNDAISSEGKDKDSKKSDSQKAPVNTLWDGVHFSFDGKKLLKYPEEPGRTRYEIPKGTVEVCRDAFFMTQLTEIDVPSSVATIRNGAFTARSGKPLFVRLPDSLKKLPSEAFVGGLFDEDLDVDDETKYYFISSPVPTLASDLCLDSENKGYRCMAYTGGPLDDLPQKAKPFAVRGFLYATEHGLEDMSKWRGSYLDHIKRNEKTYIKQALSDAFLLNLMLEESLLSEKGTRTLLNEAEANGRTDLTAALLEYQQKHFGDKSSGTLSLSDDDPEFKRMQKTAARREAIKGQKGINGIVFVETGEMKNFGDYDEYTGAKDMSDLKAYIEERGGILRSAVSSNTDYLICNDPNSDTVKSKKAKELGVPIITEDQFLKMANEKE